MHAAEASVSETTEQNMWPVSVLRTQDDGTARSEEHLGPLFFSSQKTDGDTAKGFRPFAVERTTDQGRFREFSVLYPIFVSRTRETSRQ